MYTVNQWELQNIGKTQNDEGSIVLATSKNGCKVPSYNPNTRLSNSPLNGHKYSTGSKGRPLMLSLSTNASTESGGLTLAQTQRVNICSRCIGNAYWIYLNRYLQNILVHTISMMYI